MASNVNFETRDDRHPVEHQFSIVVGGSVCRFTLAVPRYIARVLTEEDWQKAGADLRQSRDAILHRAVMSGSYFRLDGQRMVFKAIEASMAELVYRAFQDKQILSGNEAWAVPEMMGVGR